MAQAPAKVRELPLAGQDFVITGRLGAFSHQQAEADIRQLGGSTSGNVTYETSYLVVGGDPGSKLDKARSLGTPLLTEEEFMHLLEELSQ